MDSMEPITLCSPSRVCLPQLPATQKTSSFPICGARHSRSSRRRSPRFSVFCGGPVRDPQTPEEPGSDRVPSPLPILRSVQDFLQCRGRIVGLCLRGGLEEGRIGGRDVVCGGGLGTLLLSTTAAALSRARASPFLGTLAANPTFVSGLVAWALAQTMKVFLNFFVERRWDLGMLFNSGGMPSSHSALCTALTASVALCHGVGDSLFPVCLGFSLIVMYDATGVRRHAGMQAAVLNMIVEDLFQGHPISQRKLKELLGHTPSQNDGVMLRTRLPRVLKSGTMSHFWDRSGFPDMGLKFINVLHAYS